MNMNNMKKLYCIIGVLTLIVVAIGATFAYFSASAKDEETITGSTNDVATLSLDVTLVTKNTSSNLVPLNIITNQTLKDNSSDEYIDSVDQFNLAMQNNCIDSNNNNICSVYKIVISNGSATNNIKVQGELLLESTSTNLKWMLINGDVKTVTQESDDSEVEMLDNTKTSKINDFNVVDANETGYLTYKTTSVEDTYINEADSVLLSSTNEEDGVNKFSSKTYYVLVWLEETGNAQENIDAGQSFNGTVTFEAVSGSGNSTGITASFLQ